MVPKILIALGERVTLTLAEALAAKPESKEIFASGPGRWQSTGSAAVIDSEDLYGESIDIVGAMVGKVLIFNRKDVDVTTPEALASKQLGAEHMRVVEEKYAVSFEVEVVPKKEEQQRVASPLDSSQKFSGLLPMNEMQEGPSENTPYGMDQENKPVAPHPGMVGPDTSSVARAHEDAEIDNETEVSKATRESSKRTSKKSTSKKSTKSADSKKSAKKSATSRAARPAKGSMADKASKHAAKTRASKKSAVARKK